MDIEEYKIKLQNEVDLAEANLIHNMSSVNVSEYIMGSGKSAFNGLPSSILANPLQTIDTVSNITRQLFKPSHILNRIFSKVGFFNSIVRNFIK